MPSALDRYTILQRLGTGGMAEVYKCRQSGLGGFEKLVVIKRILPHLVENQAFVEMFLDEARIAANLSHANIVQVFEIDADPRGVPYIVMEYVAGPSMQQLIRRAREAGRQDLRHMARLMEGASRGLHHAHHACDAQGRPLNIVHRDISLQNILVTLEGQAKLADFGVARADGRLTHTDSGVVKGKVRYTAPEVLVDPDKGVHARSDVFGLGVCLYVASTGEYPFTGATDLKVMEAIHEGKYPPPSSYVPGFPQELEEIIAWLLENDPKRRCPSALAAAERLRAWVAAGSGSSDAELGPWVASLWTEQPADALQPPPPPVEQATPDTSSPEVLDAVDVIFSDAHTTGLAQRRTNRLWALAAVLVLGGATTWAVLSSRRQAEEAANERAQRTTWLDQAQKQLGEGHFLLAEEALRRGAAVPNPGADDELRIAQLEADLRLSRSLAAAQASLQAGNLEGAGALLTSLSHVDSGDARVVGLSRELEQARSLAAVQASLRAGDLDGAGARLATLPPQSSGDARVVALVRQLEQARAALAPVLSEPVDAGQAKVEKRRPRAVPVESPVTEANPVTEPPAEVAPEPPAPQPSVPPPPKREPVLVQRVAREGRPGLHITASVRAQVFLDGLPIGWTPLDVQEVTPATHLVMAWVEGYESVTERVVISNGEHLSLSFPMRVAQ